MSGAGQRFVSTAAMKKQFDMRHEFAACPTVTFMVGDVRDVRQVLQACSGIDIVFHAAALKQVPNCELFPMEAIKTNVLGAENLISAAIENGVERVVAVSTDKAVKPVNVMGMTKGAAGTADYQCQSLAAQPGHQVLLRPLRECFEFAWISHPVV